MKLIIKNTLGNYYSARSLFTLASIGGSYKYNIRFCLEWLRVERENMALGLYKDFKYENN